MKSLETLDKKDHELCPICKNGMNCESIVFHAKQWNIEKGDLS